MLFAFSLFFSCFFSFAHCGVKLSCCLLLLDVWLSLVCLRLSRIPSCSAISASAYLEKQPTTKFGSHSITLMRGRQRGKGKRRTKENICDFSAGITWTTCPHTHAPPLWPLATTRRWWWWYKRRYLILQWLSWSICFLLIGTVVNHASNAHQYGGCCVRARISKLHYHVATAV